VKNILQKIVTLLDLKSYINGFEV